MCAGLTLGRFVQKKLCVLHLWEDPYLTVRESLREGVAVCEQWVAACDHLTGQVWKRFSPHLWEEETLRPHGLTNLTQRLEEVRHTCPADLLLMNGPTEIENPVSTHESDKYGCF